MNEKGKLKHWLHTLAFRRGETPEEDVVVMHVVSPRHRSRATYKKMCRYVQSLPGFDTAQYVGWVAEEAYWRQRGLAGRPK